MAEFAGIANKTADDEVALSQLQNVQAQFSNIAGLLTGRRRKRSVESKRNLSFLDYLYLTNPYRL